MIHQAKLGWCDNQAPPLLSGGAARQEEYKRGGTQGYQLHGSFHP